MKNTTFLLALSILVVVISSCSVTDGGKAEAEKAIRDAYSSFSGGYLHWKIDDVSQIEVTGKGKTLPNEENFGVEAIYCANVEIDAREDTAGRFLWFSYLVTKTGDQYDVYHAYDTDWRQHSCPGEYKEGSS